MSERAFESLRVDWQTRLGISPDVMIRGRLPQEWMGQGGYDEDFLATARSLHHFYDPVSSHEAGLTITVNRSICAPVGVRADRWALGRSAVNSNGINSAQQAYWNTIIGRNPGTRNWWLAQLFYDLGHIIHLVQDMAQPEHTRNDQHLFAIGALPSLYEEWGAINLMDPKKAAVRFDGFPIVHLPDYESYFHTIDGRGLADFSNRNFVTQDTNYSDGPSNLCDRYARQPRCFYYDLPRIEEAAARTVVVDEWVIDSSDGMKRRLRVNERIFTYSPKDAYTKTTEIDPFHTFYSALDLETRKYGCNVYSLGEGSYLSRAALLVPRAVGYSAGLVEHFFRGSISAQWIEKPAGRYDLRITNTSSETIGADAMLHVSFRATPDYFGSVGSDDTSFIVGGALTELVTDFAGMRPGEAITIPDVEPRGLKPGDSITNFERRIALRGTLGFQSGDVIGLVQAPSAASGLRFVVASPTHRGYGSLIIFSSDLSKVHLWINGIWGPSVSDPSLFDIVHEPGLTTVTMHSVPIGETLRVYMVGEKFSVSVDGTPFFESAGSYASGRVLCSAPNSCAWLPW